MNPSGNPELTLSRLLEKARLSDYNTLAAGVPSASSSPGLGGVQQQNNSLGLGAGAMAVGAGTGSQAGTGASTDPSSHRIIVGVDFGTTYSG